VGASGTAESVYDSASPGSSGTDRGSRLTLAQAVARMRNPIRIAFFMHSPLGSKAGSNPASVPWMDRAGFLASLSKIRR